MHEQDQVKAGKAFLNWFDGTDSKTFEEMANEGAKAEDALYAASNIQIAFADKGDQQQAFINAADYSDEWAECFRAWYICQAKQGEGWGNCNTLIASKRWDTLHDEPEATWQRWHCGSCGARYKTAFGLLIEVKKGGIGCYILAEFPPNHMGDFKAAIIQQRYGSGCESPGELFARLPDLRPASTTFFEPLLRGWKDHGKK